MTDALPLTAARIGELLRLQIILEQPDLTLFDVRLYLAGRPGRPLPLDYHVPTRPPGRSPIAAYPFPPPLGCHGRRSGPDGAW